MKVLATLLLSLSLPGTHFAPLPRQPVDRERAQQPNRKGGRWYFAENGHAVYCYGPVRLLPHTDGGFQRIATFCQGERPMVPLKD